MNKDKETKKKSNAQKAIPGLIVAIVSLLIILTCAIIAYYHVYTSSKQNANVLEGVYSSSYYSMVDNVNNLHVDVSKFSTLTTKQSKLNTLQDIMADCNYILAGLGPNIPIQVAIMGNIDTDMKSEFIEQGINQTLHRIYAVVTCKMKILTPIKNFEREVTNQVMIAEHVILGDIPDSYYNLNGINTEDTLNVLE